MEKKENIYVIIGNGIAGLTAAAEIRKADETAIVKIISQENYLTYYRVKLSHYISKDFEPKELFIHDENWYKEREIELILGKKVKRIDAENMHVVLVDDKEVPYDKLLIANGSSAFVPPVKGKEKAGVYALRSLKDLMKIQDYLKDCIEVAIIGGGLLGMEAAWALKERGLNVHVIEFSPYLLPRQLDEELATFVKEKLEEKGLNIHIGAATQEIIGNTKATGVGIKDGRIINGEMILFSTGIRPNINIANDTKIKVDKGILVDEAMETSIPNIYAAGDIAQISDGAMGLWSVAMDQGKVAGMNMVGNKTSYKPVQPATLLSIGGFSLFSMGVIDKEKETIAFKNKEVFHKLFTEKGKLVGGVLAGDTKKMVKLKRAVADQIDLQDMMDKGLDALEIINEW
ncbi:NAD(P)/FAD-dependent oxidoreductase [Marinisporobacter balticus]|uniref:Nitrite reductase (NADH) large subunit n=1 Tax=Marinisporobacter balticus TaxID=2018667 RepID=A0A4R2KVW8_9FIRM|nr:FAD-dependent oxidoreductase [Marinisporobacter balticus]TCO77983.1 nitrite reductase (NADH) large subunit [Marinisporobacter balticus]